MPATGAVGLKLAALRQRTNHVHRHSKALRHLSDRQQVVHKILPGCGCKRPGVVSEPVVPSLTYIADPRVALPEDRLLDEIARRPLPKGPPERAASLTLLRSARSRISTAIMRPSGNKKRRSKGMMKMISSMSLPA